MTTNVSLLIPTNPLCLTLYQLINTQQQQKKKDKEL